MGSKTILREFEHVLMETIFVLLVTNEPVYDECRAARRLSRECRGVRFGIEGTCQHISSIYTGGE
jgi:hypothetical protein